MNKVPILIAVEDAVAAGHFQRQLTELGYAASVAQPSAPAFSERIEEIRPRLVLWDISLDGRERVSVGEEIRQRLDIPIVYLADPGERTALQQGWTPTSFDWLRQSAGASEMHSAIEMALYKHETERILRRRELELITLNDIGILFNSSLDQDQVLATVLDKVRGLLGVAASSIWLLDHHSNSVVCRQTTGPGSSIVRGWRLPLGEGIVGWVAHHGKSLIVSDLRSDPRHFHRVDQQTGIEMRSALSVPLQAKGQTIGVIQVMDTEPDRFEQADLSLIESLASPAAIAIENARLYRQALSLKTFNENIVQSMQEGILIEDDKGRITFVNPKACELLDYEPEELIGQPWRSIVAGRDIAAAELEYAKRCQGISSRYEAALLTRQGELLPAIISARPLFQDQQFAGVLAVFTDITDRVEAEREREELISELQQALARVKMLSGLLPICSSCKKIRDDNGYWHRVEEYIQEHSEADFSHGLCPDCARKLYPDIFGQDEML